MISFVAVHGTLKEEFMLGKFRISFLEVLQFENLGPAVQMWVSLTLILQN